MNFINNQDLKIMIYYFSNKAKCCYEMDCNVKTLRTLTRWDEQNN